ncbi:MAG: hypothetical protein IBX64_05445 [Actinobacteria bacterium]|nr:hypothetical protein [Actinomycetota bacterium]
MEGLTSEQGDTSDITSAWRIDFKRKQTRRKRLLKFKQGLLVILLMLSLGLTGYAATEIGAYKSGEHIEAGASVEPEKTDLVYDRFATVGISSLELSLPGKEGSIIGVGFHEAERQEALAITPSVEYLNKETTATVRNAVAHLKGPVFFVMGSRGRRSAPTSAIDVAMVPYAEIYSPVDGIVTTVKTYNLYNKVIDYHVEIQPDGYPDLRVVIIHIDNVQLKVGQKLERRETFIGWLRPLPQIKSQINKYLPEPADHIHIQVNPMAANGSLGS